MQAYIHEIAGAIENQQGEELASLFNIQKLELSRRRNILNDVANAEKLNKVVQSFLRQYKPYDQVTVSHLMSNECFHRGDFISSYKFELQASEGIVEILTNDRESNWWIPLVNSVVTHLRLSAQAADRTRESSGDRGKDKYMIETQDILKTRYLQRMIMDRSVNQSKKTGSLFIIVHLFKIYFKINNLRLCSFLVNMVRNPTFPRMETFPLSQTVSYHYYLGRLKIFEQDYPTAEEYLYYAFKHCHKSSFRNKKRILHFLVPVRLLSGKIPSIKLLQKYKLSAFEGIVKAIKSGNIKSYNESLESRQEQFINKGIFLILEKLKNFAYRNLFRKVYKMLQSLEVDPSKKHQLPLPLLITALNVNGIVMDTDELECILANLIFDGNMKGYIAHKRCVVLSKADPFPS